MIPRIAHFVFGLREQDQPFHFLHYVSVESCRRVLATERIYFHVKHRPWGPWWDRILPHLTLIEVDEVEEVLTADYVGDHVPAEYRYAHHADFIRLDALLKHGGVYADIDTIFVRSFPDELFEPPFVIGREDPIRDEETGESRPSLCNALLMAEPGAEFAQRWRAQMAGALNGTWSNHSGFLPEELCRLIPHAVRVERPVTFFPFLGTADGLASLLTRRVPIPSAAVSVHLWAHLWWSRERLDFSPVNAEWCTPRFLRRSRTTLGDLVRPYLPDSEAGSVPAGGARARRVGSPAGASREWRYLSLDDRSGYGVAAERCVDALEASGLDVEWIPFSPELGWGAGLGSPLVLAAFDRVGPPRRPEGEPTRPEEGQTRPGRRRAALTPVVAHLVPEFIPLVRERAPDALIVSHTVWDTTHIPDPWIGWLDQADLIVVPSRFSAAAIAASPVTTPVQIVPHVAPQADPRLSNAGLLDGIASDTFVFYTIGEWTERKAIFRTIAAYLRAFSGHDRVLLIVKSTHQDMRRPDSTIGGTAAHGTTAWALARLLGGHPDPPQIRLITRTVADDEIAALHHRGDCYVSLCRSEGWGLGAFDAAAYGKPVVMTGFGGQLDYLEGSPYLVGFELVPVYDPATLMKQNPDQRWADPDIDHAAALLRQIAADPRDAAASAQSRAGKIRDRYRPEAVAEIFRAAVDAC
jgi:glycosyltransferase involved in cell wall biosynthesis